MRRPITHLSRTTNNRPSVFYIFRYMCIYDTTRAQTSSDGSCVYSSSCPSIRSTRGSACCSSITTIITSTSIQFVTATKVGTTGKALGIYRQHSRTSTPLSYWNVLTVHKQLPSERNYIGLVTDKICADTFGFALLNIKTARIL